MGRRRKRSFRLDLPFLVDRAIFCPMKLKNAAGDFLHSFVVPQKHLNFVDLFVRDSHNVYPLVSLS